MKKGDVMKVMKTKTFDGFVGLSDQIIFCLRDFLSPVHDTWKAHLLCKRVIIITASAQVLTIIFDFVSVWFLFALLGFLHVFFFSIYLFYLFLAALDLCCCAWAFSSCGERGLLFVVVCRLLIAVASLVTEHRL